MEHLDLIDVLIAQCHTIFLSESIDQNLQYYDQYLLMFSKEEAYLENFLIIFHLITGIVLIY